MCLYIPGIHMGIKEELDMMNLLNLYQNGSENYM